MKKDNIKSTYKSDDTEEWLDKVWTRPIGYWWARLFERLNVHPNTVTILSMIIGASSALFFAHGSYFNEGTKGLLLNVIAILLLAWANFYDSADGQLARMTGKKTRLGRILDGAASEVWFVPIYLSIVYRFYVHHTCEFHCIGIADTTQNTWISTLLLLAIVLYSGFVCHSRQCGISDYYRQIHLFFLKGEAGSELDNSAQQQQIYDNTPWQGNFLWKTFLKTYVNYTRTQEAKTPEFQLLMNKLRERYGAMENIPQTFREHFRELSLPLMKYTNILTFNTRAIALYILCLADLPWLYFFFEIFVMGGLCRYMRWRHERMCRQLCKEL
ncbi:MAG: CDP-alcohol phosphatidyltransferase family protein [Prevotella sp.]|nr:CDP-alcohol phosphatidyltransferase family protein [Prevotella sp.]